MLSVAWRIALVGLLVLPPAAIGQIEQVQPAPRLPWDVEDGRRLAEEKVIDDAA